MTYQLFTKNDRRDKFIIYPPPSPPLAAPQKANIAPHAGRPHTRSCLRREKCGRHCCWAVAPLLLETLGAQVPLTVGARESPFTPVQTRLRR